MFFYHVCPTEGHRDQDGPGPGDLGFEPEKYIGKYSFDMHHFLVILYQVRSNEGPRVKDGPGPGVSGLNH